MVGVYHGLCGGRWCDGETLVVAGFPVGLVVRTTHTNIHDMTCKSGKRKGEEK